EGVRARSRDDTFGVIRSRPERSEGTAWDLKMRTSVVRRGAVWTERSAYCRCRRPERSVGDSG
ncbi:MAG: hypothetical protein ABI837_04200, partial [Acidobacteriota bacterium]